MTTFRGPVSRAARCFGARDATIDAVTGDATTFAELAHRTARIANHLDALDVPRGARVAVLADGSARYAALYLGIPAAGRVVVPLNFRYTLEELRAASGDSDPQLLLTDWDPGPLAGLAPTVLPIDQWDLDDAPNDAPTGPPASNPEPGEDDPAAIFYTGGTTDRAKGVTLSHRNKIVDALSLITSVELTAEDRWLVMSPMFHAAGSFNVLPCVWVGTTQVFLPRFDAEAVLRAIEQDAITITFAVPTMLQALADAQERIGADTSSLRLIGHGGAPITAALQQRTVDTFPGTELCAMYGATEMAPLATVHRHQERILGTPKAKSAGPPVLGVEVVPVDDQGNAVADGEIGELEVSGPNIMLGYWGKPDETARVLHGRTYRSGDLGYRDAEGYIYVVDRSKDMIITGGENVYGVEVEDVLASHPAVVESAVLGRRDARWGELVVAIVVTRSPITGTDLDDHCRSRIAGYKTPREYVFRDAPLPRSAAGKLLKRELRGLAELQDTDNLQGNGEEQPMDSERP